MGAFAQSKREKTSEQDRSTRGDKVVQELELNYIHAAGVLGPQRQVVRIGIATPHDLLKIRDLIHHHSLDYHDPHANCCGSLSSCDCYAHLLQKQYYWWNENCLRQEQ